MSFCLANYLQFLMKIAKYLIKLTIFNGCRLQMGVRPCHKTVVDPYSMKCYS